MPQPYKPYKGCPSLAWIIASRVTDRYRDQDALVLVTGPKGSGKSIFSLTLAENIAKAIAEIKGGKPEDYFTIANVRSVDPHGTMEVLSSNILQKENSIVILDDASISWNARDFARTENKAMNSILTISRVYRCVLILNTPGGFMIDKIPRTLVDYSIKIISLNTYNKQTLSKVFTSELNDQTGKEYRRFLTWKGMRIRYWVSGLPSPKMFAAYKILRRERTDEHVAATYEKFILKSQQAQPKKRKNGIEDIVLARNAEVKQLYATGASLRGIARKLGVTATVVDRCLAA